MPDFRRPHHPGGTFFFTLVTEQRAPILCTEVARTILHNAITTCQASRPFTLNAIVLLPDHLHAIWTLPAEDADFSTRWAFIKAAFTKRWLAEGGTEQRRTGTRIRHRRRGVWQRRFWDHWIRDPRDLERHLHYVHYNPVKHGHARCPHAWPYSTFGKWVVRETYKQDWSCSCNGRVAEIISFDDLDERAIEMGE